MIAASPAAYDSLAGAWRRRQARRWAMSGSAAAAILAAFAYAGALDLARYSDALPTIAQLASGVLAAGFRPLAGMGAALLETLATGVAGTALGGCWRCRSAHWRRATPARRSGSMKACASASERCARCRD